MNTRRASVLWRIVLITTLIWSPTYGADEPGSVRQAAYESGQPVYVAPQGWGTQAPGSYHVGGSGGGTPSAPFGMQIRYRSQIGDSFYGDGSQQFGAMLPWHIDPGTSLLFVEGRGIVSNHEEYGYNAGGGLRFYSEPTNRTYSISGWYDNDDTQRRRYQRYGISFASLTDHGIDVRANGYWLDDRNSQFISRTTGIPLFSGFDIAQATDTRIEVPYDGADFEVGIPAPFAGDYGFKVYAGGYFYDTDDRQEAYGPKVRVQGRVSQNLSAQIQVTDDEVFGTQVFGAITINFPGGGVRPIFTRTPTAMLMAAEEERLYRVPVNDEVTRVSSVAINPADLEPFMVYHVDNTAPAGGDGSFEMPFNVLPGSAPSDVDIIFVRRGDETDTGYTGGFGLRDDQRLLGEGTVHFYTSVEGTFELPGFTPGVNPLLGGTVSMIGDRTEVAGFRIGAITGGNAIDVTGEDFIIRSIDIDGSTPDGMGGTMPVTQHGIRLANATGVGLISDVDITVTEVDGINVLNSDLDTLDLTIEDTTISLTGRHGIHLTNDTGIDVLDDPGSTLITLIDNVDVTAAGQLEPGNGLDVDSSYFNSTLDLTITDSTFDDNFGDGANFYRVDDTFLTVDIFRSSFDSNMVSPFDATLGGSGINITGRHGAQTQFFNIVDSTMNDNSVLGLEIRGEADAVFDIDLTDNSLSRNGSGGILMTSFERIVLTGVWTRNEINDNVGDGVNLGAGLIDLVMTDNDILRNAGDGFDLTVSPGDTVVYLLDLNGNHINGNLFHGFDSSNSGGTTLVLDVDASADRFSQFNSNGLDGMEFSAEGQTDFVPGTIDSLFVTINDTEINFNGQRGIDSLTKEDGDSEFYVIDSQVSGNQWEGIYVVNTSSAVQNQTDDSSQLLDDTGRIDETPNTVFYLEGNEIDANGSILSGTVGTLGGIVFQVGTSGGLEEPMDGNIAFQDPGGFASDGRGGLVAGIVDNNLSGNYGDDVVIRTFVSTVDPATGTDWDDTTFDPTGYESDPLSRIDLAFRGNIADSINVTDSAPTLSNPTNVEAGAYYFNDDPVFKSRDDQQTDPGPFADQAAAVRRRNATRQAFRGGLPPATPGGLSDTFLYPGLGLTTLRLESNFDVSGINIQDVGFFPPPPATGFPFIVPPFQFGELQFEWDDSLAPGSLFP